MTNDPVPLAERPTRTAGLEREIEELSHIEEALVEAAIARGEPVHRSASALPQAVLGVRIVYFPYDRRGFRAPAARRRQAMKRKAWPARSCHRPGGAPTASMSDFRRAKMLGHRRKIERYCRLLATELTDLERQYLHKRIAEEHAHLERLEKSKEKQQGAVRLLNGGKGEQCDMTSMG